MNLRCKWCLFGLLSWVAMVQCAIAQPGAPVQPVAPFTEQFSGEQLPPPLTSFDDQPGVVNLGNSGMSYTDVDRQFRPRFKIDTRGGGMYGYELGNTSLGMFVPFQIEGDTAILFLDARGMVTHDGSGGANIGAGWRWWMEDIDRIVGLSAFYDNDNGQRGKYNQIGLSFESLGRYVEYRVNGYIPIGTKETFVSSSVDSSTLAFQENSLVFSRTNVAEQTYTGFDAEVGGPLPVVGRYGVNGYVGGYHLIGNGAKGGTATGASGRFMAQLNEDVSFGMQFTDDNVFGSNTQFQVFVTLPDGVPSRWLRNPRVQDRMTQSVYRQNRVLAHVDTYTTYDKAINPSNNLPYFVTQIDPNLTAAGNGTIETPFDSIAQYNAQGLAQQQHSDILYVRPRNDGSSTNLNTKDTLTLFNGQRLLSTAVPHTLQTTNFPDREFLLPSPTGFPVGGAKPMLFNSSEGDVITFAPGATSLEVSGFDITGSATGNGIAGAGNSFVSINNNIIHDALNGVLLTNMSGTTTRGVGGNVFVTGHDIGSNEGQNGFDSVILDYLRGVGTPETVDASAYSLAVIGSDPSNWSFSGGTPGNPIQVKPGYESTTFYDTDALIANPALWDEVFSKNGIVVLSYENASGGNVNAAGVEAIDSQAARFSAAISGGTDVWANSGGNNANYYNFLPTGVAATGSPINAFNGFLETSAGAAIGITNVPPNSMINGFETFNSLSATDAAYTVMETRPVVGGAETISVGVQNALIGPVGVVEPGTAGTAALITDNTFRNNFNDGFRVTNEGAAQLDVVVHRNTFSLNGGNGLRLDSNAGSVIGGFLGGEDTAAVLASTTTLGSAAILRGNTFTDNGEAGLRLTADSGTLNFGSPPGPAISAIINNVFQDNNDGVVVTSTNDSTMNLSIIDNTVSNNVSNGFALMADSGTTRLAFGGKTAEKGNRFTNNGLSGILVDLNGTAEMPSLNIQNNTMTLNGTGLSVGDGINIQAADQSLLIATTILDNVITQSGRHGVLVHATETASVSNLEISRNDINTNGTDIFGSGVYLHGEGGSVFNAKLNTNSLNSNRGDGLTIESSGLANPQMTVDSIANSFRLNEGNGINVIAGGAAVIQLTGINTSIPSTGINNTMDENGGNGLSYTAFGTSIIRSELSDTTANTNGLNGIFAESSDAALIDLKFHNIAANDNRDGDGIRGLAKGNSILSMLVNSPAMLVTSPELGASTFSGNTGNGISLTSDDTGFISASFDGVEMEDNSLNGLNINRACTSLFLGTVVNSTISNNADDGIHFLGTGSDPADPTQPLSGLANRLELINVAVDSNGGSGFSAEMYNHAAMVLNATTTSFTNHLDGDGVRVELNPGSQFGYALGAERSIFDGVTITGNGLNGISIRSNISATPLTEPASRTFFEINSNTSDTLIANNGRNGVQLNYAGGLHNVLIQGDTNPALPANSTTIQSNTADGVNVVIGNYARAGVAIDNVSVNDNTGDGIDFETTGAGAGTLTVHDSRILDNGGQGIFLGQSGTEIASGNINADVTTSYIKGNKLNGVYVNFNGSLTQNNLTFIGNDIDSNGEAGFFMQTNSVLLSAGREIQFNSFTDPFNPNLVNAPHWNTGNSTGIFGGGLLSNYLNLRSAQDTALIFTNNLVHCNGTGLDINSGQGFVLHVGTNTRVSADVRDNTFTGNLGKDVEVISCVSLNSDGVPFAPGESVLGTAGDPTATPPVPNEPSTVFLDDTAQLYMRFTGNTGNAINLGNPFNNGAFYGPDPTGLKGLNSRSAQLFQIDDGYNLNAPVNTFITNGVTQNIVNEFYTAGWYLAPSANPLFPISPFPQSYFTSPGNPFAP